MVLIDLSDIEDEECYVYRLDVGEPSGTIGAAYAYAYQSDNIYMQGQGGQWLLIVIDNGNSGESDSPEGEISTENALDFLYAALSEAGVDIGETELSEYYGEPQNVLTEDYSDYVAAWIFQDEDAGFYAVTMNGEAYKYDLVNGALMALDK